MKSVKCGGKRSSNMELEIGKTYSMRNGETVFIYDAPYPDLNILMGYSLDRQHIRFNAKTGKANSYYFGGPVFDVPEHEVVGYGIDLRDDKWEWIGSVISVACTDSSPKGGARYWPVDGGYAKVYHPKADVIKKSDMRGSLWQCHCCGTVWWDGLDKS